MKHHNKSIKEAHAHLLMCFEELKSVSWYNRILRTGTYEKAYRNMMDAIRSGSAWIEQGRATDEERQAALKDQRIVEQYVQQIGLSWDHPWNRGN